MKHEIHYAEHTSRPITLWCLADTVLLYGHMLQCCSDACGAQIGYGGYRNCIHRLSPHPKSQTHANGMLSKE